MATEDEIFINLEAVKGLVYCQKVMAILDLSFGLNQTNGMICQEYPKLMIEMILQEQASHIGNLIANLLGSTDKTELEEFMKIVTPLINRRVATKRAATTLISKLAGDSDV